MSLSPFKCNADILDTTSDSLVSYRSLCPGEKPHEEELHKVGVDEKKLCALAAFRP